MITQRSQLVHVVKSHLNDFQQILKEQRLNPEKLYDNNNLFLFIKSLKDDSLIGIVLGYGKNNAALYQKYHEMDLKEWPLTSIWADEDDKQLERLHEKELTLQPWDITDLFYPYFACDPESEETRQLKQIYRAEREKIVNYYNGKDIVEATLSLFNQN